MNPKLCSKRQKSPRLTPRSQISKTINKLPSSLLKSSNNQNINKIENINNDTEKFSLEIPLRNYKKISIELLKIDNENFLFQDQKSYSYLFESLQKFFKENTSMTSKEYKNYIAGRVSQSKKNDQPKNMETLTPQKIKQYYPSPKKKDLRKDRSGSKTLSKKDNGTRLKYLCDKNENIKDKLNSSGFLRSLKNSVSRSPNPSDWKFSLEKKQKYELQNRTLGVLEKIVDNKPFIDGQSLSSRKPGKIFYFFNIQIN